MALLSVATLVAETNSFTGFDNLRQLVSFAAGPPGGYDVVENQLGKRVGKTTISKKGNMGPPGGRIRQILHLPAFNAVRFGGPSCQALFERVRGRTRIKMKGYVAVQKKLFTLCYALWKNDTAYDATYYMQQAKKIVPPSGTTQDQSAVAELSFG